MTSRERPVHDSRARNNRPACSGPRSFDGPRGGGSRSGALDACQAHRQHTCMDAGCELTHRYDDREIAIIIKLATELEKRAASGEGHSLREIQEIAAQARLDTVKHGDLRKTRLSF